MSHRPKYRIPPPTPPGQVYTNVPVTNEWTGRVVIFTLPVPHEYVQAEARLRLAQDGEHEIFTPADEVLMAQVQETLMGRIQEMISAD